MGVEQILGHVPALRRYARLLTGNGAHADDLVQDTLERACRKWALWQPGPALRGWLLSLMHNLHENQRRDWRHDHQADALDAHPEPHHEPWSRTGDRIDLEQALAELPIDMRQVLLLVTVEDYTYAEAAEILQVPIGTVMSRLHRARERLRRRMSDTPPTAAPEPSQEPAPAGEPGRAHLRVVK